MRLSWNYYYTINLSNSGMVVWNEVGCLSSSVDHYHLYKSQYIYKYAGPCKPRKTVSTRFHIGILKGNFKILPLRCFHISSLMNLWVLNKLMREYIQFCLKSFKAGQHFTISTWYIFAPFVNSCLHESAHVTHLNWNELQKIPNLS